MARGLVPGKIPSIKGTAREWDRLADRRDLQLRSGRDLSFSNVIAPTLQRLCERCDWSRVLDAGCGTGVLTERLARRAKYITGIDVSSRSIELARSHSDLSYEVASIERFGRANRSQFTLIVANMVLMNAPSLTGTVRSLAKMLKPGGHFVFAITHPWFWPLYWGYASAKWFSYERAVAIEAQFRISLDHGAAPLRSTHIHRPLQAYVEALDEEGLLIESIREPVPSRSMQRRYPRRWREPRFLLARCRKGM